jgi:hypothetical protein
LVPSPSSIQCHFMSVRFCRLDGNLSLNCNICWWKGTYQKITVAYLRGGPQCSDPSECLRDLVGIQG